MDGNKNCGRLFSRGDSSGAIVFRKAADGLQVLMLSHGSRGWVFPKVAVAEGSTEEETAVNEVMDSSGIAIRLIPEFRTEACSGLKKDARKMIYRIGLAPETAEPVIKDPEHSMPAWKSISEVKELLRFPEDYPPFEEALIFLDSHPEITEI